MSENEEVDLQLRANALQLAISSSTPGLKTEEVVRRAEAYLAFLKGTTNAQL